MDAEEENIDDYIDYEVEYTNKNNYFCNIAYFPDGGFTIVNHWRIKLLRPLCANLFFLIAQGIFIYDLYSSLAPGACWACSFCATLVFFFVIVSFWMIVFIGPGYVPYNWRLKRRKTYGWKEQMKYITIYEQQVQCARMSERPNRSSFSIEARRFVLRADHLCIWTASWIGFKNHRYFVNFVFWLFVYGCLWFGLRFDWIKMMIKSFKLRYCVTLVFSLLILLTTVYSFYHFVNAVRNLAKNITGIEKYMHRNTKMYDKGCFGNFEEVLGNRKFFLCWFIPFVPIPRVHDGFYET